MQKLKYSKAPYIGLNIIFGCLSLFMLHGFIFWGEWEPIIVIIVAWPVFMSLWYLFQHGYKVWLEGDTVYCRAADYKTVTSINIPDIRKVAIESKIVQIKNGSYRPNLRVSLYGEDKEHFVDISLRHFEMESIRELIRYIHEKHPNLDIPKQLLIEKKKV